MFFLFEIIRYRWTTYGWMDGYIAREFIRYLNIQQNANKNIELNVGEKKAARSQTFISFVC